MKITAKQYARALYAATKDQKTAETKRIIKEFVVLIARNNDLAKAGNIINEFIQVYNQEQGIVEVEISSARALDGGIIKLFQNYLKDLTQAEIVKIKQAERKEVLGGVVIKYGDKIIDSSLKTKLNSLKQEMKK